MTGQQGTGEGSWRSGGGSDPFRLPARAVTVSVPFSTTEAGTQDTRAACKADPGCASLVSTVA